MTEKDLLSGFLTSEGNVLDRPEGFAQNKEGRLYISDDYNNALYRDTQNPRVPRNTLR